MVKEISSSDQLAYITGGTVCARAVVGPIGGIVTGLVGSIGVAFTGYIKSSRKLKSGEPITLTPKTTFTVAALTLLIGAGTGVAALLLPECEEKK